MISITSAEQVAWQSGTQKNLILVFDINGTNKTLDNSMIVAESMSLRQTISDDSNNIFGNLYASQFNVRVFDDGTRFKGATLTARLSVTLENVDGYLVDSLGRRIIDSEGNYLIVNTDEDVTYTRQLGVFEVMSDKLTSDGIYRDLVCYDSLSAVLKSDYSAWHNKFSFPATVKNYRNAFFAYLGITQNTVTLPNDSMTINENDMETLSGATILSAILGLNGCWGYLGSDNVFNYVLPKSTVDYTISDNSFIQGSYAFEEFETMEYSGIIFQNSITNTITETDYSGETYTYEENTEQNVTIGDATGGVLKFQDNVLLKGKTDAQLTSVGNTLLNALDGFTFTPSSVTFPPYMGLELGDVFQITTTKGTYSFPVLDRTLSGITGLKDVFAAEGVECPTENANSVQSFMAKYQASLSDVQDLTNKTNKLANEVQIAGETNQYFWHTESIEYYLTTDTSVDTSKTYYEKVGTVYSEVTNPSGNPSAQGWYEAFTDTGSHITEIPKEDFMTDPESAGGNLLARSNGIAIRNGLLELATFSSSGTTIGNPSQNHSLYNANGAYWYLGNSNTPYMSIENGVLRDSANKNYWNMLTGEMSITATTTFKVWTTQPTPPYSKDDLWVQGSNGDIKVCTNSRESGSYVASDWVLSSKYTDDTYAKGLENGIIATHTTQIQNNSDAISLKANATDVYTKTTVDGLIEQEVTDRNSAITLSANGIRSEVSQSISAIQVGGRNLLRHTKSLAVMTTASDGYLHTVNTTKGTISGTYKGASIIHVDDTSASSSYIACLQWKNIYAKFGSTYTISFWAKADTTGTNKFAVYFHGDTGYTQVAKTVTSQGVTNTNANGLAYISLTSEWERYWVTWTLKDTGDESIGKAVLFRLWYGADVYIAGAKLEEGNKASDWTEAPEDVESYTESKIEQLADSITLSVTGGSVGNTAQIKLSVDGGSTYQTGTIDLTGIVTFTDLSTSGRTTIHGGNITTGTITASKITGSITNSGWGIDFDNGTFSIGNISASNIASGTIFADRIGANSITADKLDVSNLSAIVAKIGDWYIGSGLQNTASGGTVYFTPQMLKLGAFEADSTGAIGGANWYIDASGNASFANAVNFGTSSNPSSGFSYTGGSSTGAATFDYANVDNLVADNVSASQLSGPGFMSTLVSGTSELWLHPGVLRVGTTGDTTEDFKTGLNRTVYGIQFLNGIAVSGSGTSPISGNSGTYTVATDGSATEYTVGHSKNYAKQLTIKTRDFTFSNGFLTSVGTESTSYFSTQTPSYTHDERTSDLTVTSACNLVSWTYHCVNKVVQIRMEWTNENAITVPANGNITNITLLTINNSYRWPDIATVGLSNGDGGGNAFYHISTSGVVTLCGLEGTGASRTIAAGTTFYMYATYISTYLNAT